MNYERIEQVIYHINNINKSEDIGGEDIYPNDIEWINK